MFLGDDENINWDEDVNYLPDNENEANEFLEEDWKLGDRCMAQSPSHPGCWYPANITMIMDDEVAVTFEHNPELKAVPKNCLRRRLLDGFIFGKFDWFRYLCQWGGNVWLLTW